jgi:hypothetical protein
MEEKQGSQKWSKIMQEEKSFKTEQKAVNKHRGAI